MQCLLARLIGAAKSCPILRHRLHAGQLRKSLQWVVSALVIGCANAETSWGYENSPAGDLSTGRIGETYIDGTIDTELLMAKREHRKPRFCIPAKLHDWQILLSVRQYINAHPEVKGIAATAVVLTALSIEYPCGNGAPSR
jgi:Rap1a immunity proteins